MGDLFPDDSRTSNEARELDPGRLTGEAWSGSGGGGEESISIPSPPDGRRCTIT